DGCCSGFLPWLQRKAGTEISSLLSIGRSRDGRGLYASGRIEEGDVLFAVPFGVQLSSENLPSEISRLLGDDVDRVAKLALLVLLEKRLGQNSEWAPYLSCLPRPDDLHSTVFWSDAELEMIRSSGLYDETLKSKSLIAENFSAVKPVLDAFPDRFPGVTLREFAYATGLVNSRAWNSYRGISLIPFADFVNHSSNSDSYLLCDETKQHSEAIADGNFAPGDEVRIRYGKKLSNADLLLDFGFTTADNRFDSVRIKLVLPQHDQLSSQKSHLLRIHSTERTDTGAHWNTFVVKEVKRGCREGKGIPQSLRAFARIVACSSAAELGEFVAAANRTDGRLARRPVGKTNEVRSHRFLATEIDKLIGEVDKQIRDISICHGGAGLGRRKLALDVLSGEVRVLKSAVSWLNSYCS
ncbi:hypothetical protein M569_11509, partial [Genlisea aurea]